MIMGLFNLNKKKADFIKIKVEKLVDWNEPNGDGCVVSDKITKEVGVTSLVSYVPITNGVICWIDEIKRIKQQALKSQNRERIQELINSGYEIKDESNRLLELYKRIIDEVKQG